MKNFNTEIIVYPEYYGSIEEAVFGNVWGTGEITSWFSEENRHVKTALVIGKRIYYRERGRMVLKKTVMSERTINRILSVVLRNDGQEEKKVESASVEMKGNTVISAERTLNDGGNVIVFRRFSEEYCTFEQLVSRKVIPDESVELFKCMIKAGMNIVVTGNVKTGKTEFLTAWQSLENPELIGELTETAPEISSKGFSKRMPLICRRDESVDLNSNKIWSVAENEADYHVFDIKDRQKAEMKAEKVALSGKQRTKMTLMTENPEFLLGYSWINCFNYVLNMGLNYGTGRRKLLGIYEICADGDNCSMNEICSYDWRDDRWNFKYCMNDKNERLLRKARERDFDRFDSLLRNISDREPYYD